MKEYTLSHTPGPWRFDEELYTVFAGDTRVALGLISPDVSPSQGAADIRLMAAAPELLDALKTLRAHADLFEIFRDDIGQAVEEVVNATIAKATGKVSEDA